jgi:hypothetical protein
MTRSTNARLAGFLFLFYIVVGVTSMIVGNGVGSGEGTTERLASIAQHATQVRIDVVLGLLMSFTALTLAVALYGITCDEDHELAILTMVCRVGEGLVPASSIVASLGLLWLGTDSAADPSHAAGAQALGGFLFKLRGWNVSLSATFFAVGSTIFCYLLLRGRMVPAPLAWLGFVASILLAGCLPAQLVGLPGGALFTFMWLPMGVFEVVLAVWLLTKGVATPVSPGVARG